MLDRDVRLRGVGVGKIFPHHLLSVYIQDWEGGKKSTV